jgi:hypothetical protein
LLKKNIKIEYGKEIININENYIECNDNSKYFSDKFVFCVGSNFKLLSGLTSKLIYNIKGYSLTIEYDDNIGLPKFPIFDTNAKILISVFGNKMRIVGIAELAGSNLDIIGFLLFNIKILG